MKHTIPIQSKTCPFRVERKFSNEVSIYDITHHPDFNFEFETQVIRITNFEGEGTCIVGYVIERNLEGRIKVGWVDGHYSMCWPQDIIPVSCHSLTIGSENEDESKMEHVTSEWHLLLDGNDLNLNFEMVKEAIDSFEKTNRCPMDNEQVRFLILLNRLSFECFVNS